jgi:hypothetical protein
MMGSELRSILRTDHQRALLTAVHVLIDQFLDDIVALQRGDHFADTGMADHLPSTYCHRYDLLVAKRFLACVYTVAWKLQSPDPQVLACVGEELALHALIQSAEAILESKGASAGFDLLRETAFEDEDYALLFDPQWDGIEDSERGRRLGIANLRFDEWFKPFRKEAPIHPYISA